MEVIPAVSLLKKMLYIVFKLFLNGHLLFGFEEFICIVEKILLYPFVRCILRREEKRDKKVEARGKSKRKEDITTY